MSYKEYVVYRAEIEGEDLRELPQMSHRTGEGETLLWNEISVVKGKSELPKLNFRDSNITPGKSYLYKVSVRTFDPLDRKWVEGPGKIYPKKKVVNPIWGTFDIVSFSILQTTNWSAVKVTLPTKAKPDNEQDINFVNNVIPEWYITADRKYLRSRALGSANTFGDYSFSYLTEETVEYGIEESGVETWLYSHRPEQGSSTTWAVLNGDLSSVNSQEEDVFRIDYSDGSAPLPHVNFHDNATGGDIWIVNYPGGETIKISDGGSQLDEPNYKVEVSGQDTAMSFAKACLETGKLETIVDGKRVYVKFLEGSTSLSWTSSGTLSSGSYDPDNNIWIFSPVPSCVAIAHGGNTKESHSNDSTDFFDSQALDTIENEFDTHILFRSIQGFNGDTTESYDPIPHKSVMTLAENPGASDSIEIDSVSVTCETLSESSVGTTFFKGQSSEGTLEVIVGDTIEDTLQRVSTYLNNLIPKGHLIRDPGYSFSSNGSSLIVFNENSLPILGTTGISTSSIVSSTSTGRATNYLIGDIGSSILEDKDLSQHGEGSGPGFDEKLGHIHLKLGLGESWPEDKFIKAFIEVDGNIQSVVKRSGDYLIFSSKNIALICDNETKHRVRVSKIYEDGTTIFWEGKKILPWRGGLKKYGNPVGAAKQDPNNTNKISGLAEGPFDPNADNIEVEFSDSDFQTIGTVLGNLTGNKFVDSDSIVFVFNTDAEHFRVRQVKMNGLDGAGIRNGSIGSTSEWTEWKRVEPFIGNSNVAEIGVIGTFNSGVSQREVKFPFRKRGIIETDIFVSGLEPNSGRPFEGGQYMTKNYSYTDVEVELLSTTTINYWLGAETATTSTTVTLTKELTLRPDSILFVRPWGDNKLRVKNKSFDKEHIFGPFLFLAKAEDNDEFFTDKKLARANDKVFRYPRLSSPTIFSGFVPKNTHLTGHYQNRTQRDLTIFEGLRAINTGGTPIVTLNRERETLSIKAPPLIPRSSMLIVPSNFGNYPIRLTKNETFQFSDHYIDSDLTRFLVVDSEAANSASLSYWSTNSDELVKTEKGNLIIDVRNVIKDKGFNVSVDNASGLAVHGIYACTDLIPWNYRITNEESGTVINGSLGFTTSHVKIEYPEKGRNRLEVFPKYTYPQSGSFSLLTGVTEFVGEPIEYIINV